MSHSDLQGAVITGLTSEKRVPGSGFALCDMTKRHDRHPRHAPPPEPYEEHAMDTAILMAELALAVTILVSITRALVMQIQRN